MTFVECHLNGIQRFSYLKDATSVVNTHSPFPYLEYGHGGWSSSSPCAPSDDSKMTEQKFRGLGVLVTSFLLYQI